jgi:hypothetical protein
MKTYPVFHMFFASWQDAEGHLVFLAYCEVK